VLPGRIHEIHYEALVADQRRETARLLERCGLAWEEDCFAYERNPEAVSTASAVQVREPLYAGAVGRWRHYERELEPLIRLLREEGIEPNTPTGSGAGT
jgi:hypothetical protein